MDSALLGPTYHIVLDSVNLLIGDVALDTSLIKVMLNLANLQNTNLLERPASDLLRKLLIRSLDLLRVSSNTTKTHAALDLGVKPSVLQHLRRSHNGKAGRVSCLHRGDQGQLRTHRERVLHALNVILGVVRVGGSRSSEDRSQKWTGVSESLPNAAGEGNDFPSLAIALEEVLHIWSYGVWSGEQDDIVLLCGADGVVVEVVYHQGIAICRKVDVEFEEKRDEGRWGRDGGGEGQEDVAAAVDELKK